MVVIADDLTGANDTAIQYRKYGVSSIVDVGLAENQHPDYFDGYEIISVNTDSRALSPSEAYDVVYKTCRLFCRDKDACVYKKTDSLLRGNPGAELEAVMNVLECDLAFVSSAYPENDRIIRNGVLYAGENRIDAVKSIASDMRHKVCSVPLQVVQGTVSGLTAYVSGKRKEGVGVFVFDACTDDDLERIYRLSQACDVRHVLCGSAGLARFDAQNRSAATNLAVTRKATKKNGIILLITGSRNAETRAQVLKASDDLHVPCIVMDKGLIVAGRSEQAVTNCMAESEKWINSGDKVLIITMSSLFREFHMVLKDSVENYRIAHDLAVCLGDLVNRIYETFPVSAIVANGGDTTMQLCSRLGAYGIEPVIEVTPGAPMGILVGGKADRMPVITKSGGFGGESALTECIRFLQDYKNSN